MGRFRPGSDTVEIDYKVASDDRNLEETLAHEFTHVGQDIRGETSRRTVEELEKEAYSVGNPRLNLASSPV